MSDIKEKIDNIKNDLKSDEDVKVSLDDIDDRLEKIDKKRKSNYLNDFERVNKYKDIKHHIEEKYGVNFCSSQDFIEFVEWVKELQGGSYYDKQK